MSLDLVTAPRSQKQMRTRTLTPADRALLAAFPARVSSASAYTRFHGAVNALSDKMLDSLLRYEPGCNEAIIAEDEAGIAGIARYARDLEASSIAEIAVIVADDRQRRGVARTLLLQLAERARRNGMDTFRATVLPSNTAVQQLLKGLWVVTAEQRIDGDIVYHLDLEPEAHPRGRTP
jgi:ribosomal protein S18 acetylase RimI-like enzyme